MEIGESDGKTGSPEIDKFVVSIENLNSNIILIKEKTGIRIQWFK